MTRITTTAGILLSLLLAAVSPPAPAQSSRATTEDPKGKKVQKPKVEWPKMTRRQKERVEVLILTLARKGGEKVKPKCEVELVEIGLPCARRLLLRFKDSPHGNINDAIARVLDKIMGKGEAPLLAQFARHKSVAGRRYVIGRLAGFHDKAWVKVLKAASKDKDDEVRFQAAVGLVATTKDEKSLALVFERCKTEWNEIGATVSKALVPARSMEAAMSLHKRMLNKTLQDKVTGLRLLRSLGPKPAARFCKPYLDAEDSILKKEAINTLRVIVDGEKPLPLTELTVFQVIEQAKKWKARL